jgi:[acyl-carrier-protein] S-malonyltransferase
VNESFALVFPGLGAHGPGIFDTVRHAPSFSSRLALVRAHAPDVADRLEDPVALGEVNAVASVATVIASVVALDMLREENLREPIACAGYSVGQWTALYAAGSISVAQLIEVVYHRAVALDAAARLHPGGMVSIVGIPLDVVTTLCAEIPLGCGFARVSNINAPGHYTVAGTHAALDWLHPRVDAHQPKRVVHVPVSGAWHCPLMADAERWLREWLATQPVTRPATPVICNVTAALLPDDDEARRDALARQVTHPVQWEASVRRLGELGARQIIEVGFGNLLTRFGFFIDRRLTHRTWLEWRSPGGPG